MCVYRPNQQILKRVVVCMFLCVCSVNVFSVSVCSVSVCSVC